jgi:hypothetical protein
MRLVVAVAALGFAIFPAGAGAADHADPVGDAGTAPDITSVTATPATTSVSFRVVVANMSSLEEGAELFLAIDADPRAGDQHGVDFVYSLRQGGAELRTRRWSGSQHAPFASTAAGRFEGGVATFVLQLAELGDPAVIGFGAIGNRAGDSDAAPGNGSWTLRLREVVRVGSLVARFAPSPPRAGRPFRVAAASARLSDGSSRAGTRSCVARVAGSRLAGRGCAWRLPASARGKRLTVSVRLLVAGVGATSRTYAFRVR